MRVAVIDTAAENGGALSVLSDYVDYLITEVNEHEWFVFTATKIKGGDNVSIIECDFPKKSWMHRIIWDNFFVGKLLKKYKIDVIISLQNTGFLFLRIPQVVYFHNVLLLDDIKKYSFFNKNDRLYYIYVKYISAYTRLTLKNAKAIVAQTNTVKKELENKWKLERIFCVNPNVCIPDIERNDVSTDGIKGLIYPAGPLRFKRHKEIIDCIKNNREWFRTNNFRIMFTFTGEENIYAKTLLQRADGIPEIEFVGYIDRKKVLQLYKEYGLIVNSELESFPIPFIEAMSFGTPILAADYSYAKEILSDYENAIFYEKCNCDSMAQAIKTIAEKKYVSPRYVSNTKSWAVVNSLLEEVGNRNENF